MTTKDILILLGLTEIAYQCIDNKTMLYDEFKSFFVGCDTNKIELQLKLQFYFISVTTNKKTFKFII